MKKIIIVSISVLSLAFSACNSSSNNQDKNSSQTFDTTKLRTGEVYYQCEMNPEVISDKPGKCIKCDMDLIKVEKK